MKKSFFMLIILFVCGIISADICIETIKGRDVLLNIDTYIGYANAQLLFKDVFWNILYERIKLFALLILLCCTPIKERILILLISLFSFVWGYYIMICVAELQMAGVVLGIASVLPHGLLYAGVLFLLFRRRMLRSYHVKDRMLLSIGVYLFMLLLFVTGCVMESLVSTHFIPWLIRLSQI